MEKRFEGKVAFVTGAATGIGQAIAVRLASEGALVGVNHLPKVDPSETLKRIKDAGGEGFPVVADVRDPKQVVAMVEQVAGRGGHLDYVVSNAGINPFMKWNETPVEAFDELSEVNFRGTWLVCTEGAKQIVSGTAVDNAGNRATASVTLNIDKTAPVVTASPSASPNAAGWYSAPVVVTFAATDTLETLTAKVHAAEHQLLPAVIARLSVSAQKS